MGFMRRVISSALNLDNLAKHNANFADIETDLTEHRGRIAVAETELATQDGRINNLVVSGGDGNPEIVDAREDYPTLRERLDTQHGAVSAQLAETADQVTEISEVKADLTYVDGTMRAKATKIRSEDLDTSANEFKIKPVNVSDELMQMFSPAGTVSPTLTPESVVREYIAPGAVDDEKIAGTFIPKKLALSNYSTTTEVLNRIFIPNIALTAKGSINVLLNIANPGNVSIYLLQKASGSNAFTVKETFSASLSAGANRIRTGMFADGNGLEYIGVVQKNANMLEYRDNPPGGTGQYYFKDSWTDSTVTFTGEPRSNSNEMGIYVEIMPFGTAEKTAALQHKLTGLESELSFDSVKLPSVKPLSSYTTQFTGAVNRIFVINTPMTASGSIALHFKSAVANNFYVVLLEKAVDSLNFSVTGKALVSVNAGINKISTPFNSSGAGNQYIGLAGISTGSTPSGYTAIIPTQGNYFNFLTFDLNTESFTATANSGGADVSVYFEITPQNSMSDYSQRISALEAKISNKTVDLVIFMGQSNMAGRGVASESPVVPIGGGYEFRAISDPTSLYRIVEPFGVYENNPSGITEAGMKTGSMVSSFVIEYSAITGRPVVAVSASKGGSSINQWQAGGAFLTDAISRYDAARTWLTSNGYTVKNKFMVWCQGETDGDNLMPSAEYTTKLTAMIDAMVTAGIDRCYIVRIGNHRDNPSLYDPIMLAQTELCKTHPTAVLVSTKFAGMAAAGMMKDQFHYTQPGYNITGADAGRNTAFHLMYRKEPYMWDPEYNNNYFSQK